MLQRQVETVVCKGLGEVLWKKTIGQIHLTSDWQKSEKWKGSKDIATQSAEPSEQKLRNWNTTSKRVGGINSGSSCWLKTSIKGAAMDSFISFSIASRQNDNNHHALAHALNKTCSGFHRCLLCLSSSFNVHQGTASSLIEQQQALSSGLS